MIRFYKFEQRSDKWYAYRKGRWTGSTAIHLLSGKNAPPEGDKDYDNKYMQRGRILEPLAIEAYEIKHGVKVAQYGFVTNTKWLHAGYSPDGVDPSGPILLEVKCLGLEKHDAIVDGTLPIPTEYIAQIQVGLLITELSKARLILYNPDSDTPMHVMDLKPDRDIHGFMVAQLERTKPATRPSLTRAQRKYVQQNPIKMREKRHERYMRSKAGV